MGDLKLQAMSMSGIGYDGLIPVGERKPRNREEKESGRECRLGDDKIGLLAAR